MDTPISCSQDMGTPTPTPTPKSCSQEYMGWLNVHPMAQEGIERLEKLEKEYTGSKDRTTPEMRTLLTRILTVKACVPTHPKDIDEKNIIMHLLNESPMQHISAEWLCAKQAEALRTEAMFKETLELLLEDNL